MQSALLITIRAYQHTLSPDHGLLKVFYPYGCCRYYPSCSDYALEAITRYGASKGSSLAVRRVMRCHPWAVGGHDPVPSTHNKKG